MSGYHEFRAYSTLHDCDMVRLSMFDQRGAEYFSMIPAVARVRYRERRNRAIEAIDYAIEQKMEPGMVITSD